MEGYDQSTYGDAIADIYDEWYGEHPSTAPAVAALVRLARAHGAGRVLELGVGSGRLALPLAAAGIEVWGIDASAAMVDRLRANERAQGTAPIPVAVGDMSRIDLRALPGGDAVRFDVVVVAINTFFLLTTADEQRNCLQRVHDVLAPGGVFVLEAFVPQADRPTNMVEARTVALDHVILTATRHDPDTQLVASQMIEIRETGIRLRPLMLRYADPDQLDAMASATGLTLRERWGDWSGVPFAEGDGVHVSLYQRN